MPLLPRAAADFLESTQTTKQSPLSLKLSPEPAKKRIARQSAASRLQGPAKRRTFRHAAAGMLQGLHVGFLATGPAHGSEELIGFRFTIYFRAVAGS